MIQTLMKTIIYMPWFVALVVEIQDISAPGSVEHGKTKLCTKRRDNRNVSQARQVDTQIRSNVFAVEEVINEDGRTCYVI